MIKYFCAGDIHSFYDEWMTALTQKGFDINNKEHHVIVCGDLLDRGPKSIECIQFMKQLQSEDRAVYVRGNHEDLLFDCCYELGTRIGSHHRSNGTVRTISHLLGISEYDVLCRVWGSEEYNMKVQPVLDWIHSTSKNFFELGSTVFVHGWVPTTITSEDDHTMRVAPNWRAGDWRSARWENGMEMFHFNIMPPDITTVVCGHWHTSYGHCVITKTCKTEFDSDACFDPFIQPGIVAVDACTAYTHKVNVVIFDEEGNLI